MLTDRDVRRIRQTVTENLPGRAIIKRASDAHDGAGGFIRTYQTIGTTRCHVLIVSRPIEDQLTGQVKMVSSYSIVVPWDTDIRATDRVEVNGAEFEIVGFHGKNDLHGSIRLSAVRLSDG